LRLLPISRTTIEVAQFDLQKIKNPEISGEEYQLGFWNVREYVLARDRWMGRRSMPVPSQTVENGSKGFGLFNREEGRHSSHP